MEDLSQLPMWGILTIIAARVAMDVYERVKARSDSGGSQQVFVSGETQATADAFEARLRDLEDRKAVAEALSSHSKTLETHSALLEQLVDHEGRQTVILERLTERVEQLPCNTSELSTEPQLVRHK